MNYNSTKVLSFVIKAKCTSPLKASTDFVSLNSASAFVGKTPSESNSKSRPFEEANRRLVFEIPSNFPSRTLATVSLPSQPVAPVMRTFEEFSFTIIP